MDNHPIPQDVTHFQFKLIGELTIKQFGYVAAGGILAWITFSLPIEFYIKLLFTLIFAGSGIIFAFIPIESRPADLMLTYFFKALFQPNQYVFRKQNTGIAFTDLPRTSSAEDNNTPSPQPYIPQQKNASLQNSQQSINTYSGGIAPLPLQTQQLPAVPLPQIPFSPVNIDKPPLPVADAQTPSAPPITTQSTPPNSNIAPVINISPQQAITDTPISQTVKQPTATAVTMAGTPAPTQSSHSTLEEQLQTTLSQKQQLENQLAQLQQQLVQKAPVSPTQPAYPAAKKIAPPQQSQAATNIPIASEFPNIIMGVIKDARGNVLQNILIEVKDSEDNPVRAFKTNALGQFASATPLLNGTYTIVFEDPAKIHSFDALQITATGEIMQPVEVVSIDQREKLRKELFG